MYKLRFAKWEFNKHNRQSDMAIILRNKKARDAQGKKSTFVVRSKEVSAQEVDRYVERKQDMDPAFREAPADMATPIHILCFTPPCSPYPESGQETSLILDEHDSVPASCAAALSGSSKRKRSWSPNSALQSELVIQQDCQRGRARTRSPSVPRQLTDPDRLRRLEMLFGSISIYFRGLIDNKTWYLNRKGFLSHTKRVTVHPVDLTSFCIEAINRFKRSSATVGRQLLSKAFSILTIMLREGDPRLLLNLFDALLQIRKHGFPEICAMIQTHIAQLARIILPEQHILRQLCASLYLSDLDQGEAITRSWRCLIDTLARTSGELSSVVVVSKVYFISGVYNHTDPKHAEKLLQKLLAEYEQASETNNETRLFLIRKLAKSMRYQGKYAEAEALLEGSLLRTRKAGALSKFWEAFLLESLVRVQHAQCKYVLAEKGIRRAIRLSGKKQGKYDPDVVRRCRLLERLLRKSGRKIEADQVSAEVEEIINQDNTEVNGGIHVA